MNTTTPNGKDSVRVATQQKPKRPPLLPSDADNNEPRRPKSREVTSRYLSSTSSSSTTSSTATSSSYSSSFNSTTRRFQSPVVSRTVASTPVPAVVKRSQSVERRRPATPRPSTPGNAGEISAAAKLLVNSRRSLSVSFQGESFSLPISKAKPAPVGNLGNGRKAATPVRDHIENSKPIDQHLWPARSQQVNSLTRSVDFTSERTRLSGSGGVVRALQKSIIDERNKGTIESKLKPGRVNGDADLANRSIVESLVPIHSDSGNVSSGSNFEVREGVRGGPRGIVVPARFWQETSNRLRRFPEQPGSPVSKNNGLKSTGMVHPKLIGTKKLQNDNSPTSSTGGVSVGRGQSSPLRGSVQPASPSKNVMSSSSSPLRGVSPSRVRNLVGSTLSSNFSNTPSMLSFAADARRGKVGENRIVDAHQLRLLYNQQLQWRFVNARADAAMLVQRGNAEKSLYNAWLTTARLRHSIKSKRIELQLQQQNLKMYSILKGQMLYLENWDHTSKDHSSSLCGAIEALEASTLRLPIVGGARADIQNLKDAICSAVDVMQAMASSICSLLIKVEHVNSLASELANITRNGHASLDQCIDLLSQSTTMQVMDCSLRTHILQLRRVSSLTTQV